MKKIVVLISIVCFSIIVSCISIFLKNKNEMNKYDVAIETLATKFYKEKFYSEHVDIIRKLSESETTLTFSFYDILVMSGYDDNYIRQTKFYQKCDIYNMMVRYKIYEPVSENSFILSYDLECN